MGWVIEELKKCSILPDDVYVDSRLFAMRSADHVSLSIKWTYVPCREKTCLRGFANNKGADQPAHRPKLFRAFVICVLESIISKHATSEILISS